MNKLKTSIALCTYNGQEYLKEQLNSIRQQSVLPDELIVCDDCSSDQTISLVQEFASESPFPVKIYKNQQNLRTTKNFEKAVSLCTGEIIFLCDQDDIWFPKKIETILRIFEENPKVGLVFSNCFL